MRSGGRFGPKMARPLSPSPLLAGGDRTSGFADVNCGGSHFNQFITMKLASLLPVTAVVLFSTLPAAGQSTFTRVTTGPVAEDSGNSNRGVWVDYDDDGDLDLFVANGWNSSGGPPQANYLYRNDGHGTFTKITSGPVVEDVEISPSGVWADYNNDGYLDLFVVHLPQEDASLNRNSLYRNNGDGRFTKITDDPIVKDGGRHTSGAWADYDNDGHLDLLVADWNSSRLLYRNNGDETFTRITQGPLATDVSAAQTASWADYDNDGDLDLFVGGFTGPPPTAQKSSLYRNEGHGTFTRITTGSVVAESAIHNTGAWGDYDNDGDLDLFVCVFFAMPDFQKAPSFLFRNNGDGSFTKVTNGELVSDAGQASAAAWGDYDNDGFLDLFVSQGEAGGNQGNFLYHNNGDGTFTRITDGDIVTDYGHSSGGDWGDYDNDGFLDLFVANTSGNQNFLYHNDGNANRWLKVKLVGTISNRAAIGAKVRVQASLGGSAQWQMREISVGSGYSGHNLIAHFGLRDAQKAEVVRIEWPSGIVQELRDVPANRILSVTEPVRLQATGCGQLQFKSWKGQAFTIEASADLTAWKPIAAVTNLTGTVEFVDPDAALSARRFYRVIQR